MVRRLKESTDEIMNAVLDIIEIAGVTERTKNQIGAKAEKIADILTDLYAVIRHLTKCENPQFEVRKDGVIVVPISGDLDHEKKGGSDD